MSGSGGSGALSGHFAASTSLGQLSGMVYLTGDNVAVTFDQLLITTTSRSTHSSSGAIGTGIYDFSGTSLKFTISACTTWIPKGTRGGEHPADVVVDRDRDRGHLRGRRTDLPRRPDHAEVRELDHSSACSHSKVASRMGQNALDVPDVKATPT